MRLAIRIQHLAIAAGMGLGAFALASAAHAEESAQGCEGQACMASVAPAGSCAVARGGTPIGGGGGGGGGGGECGDTDTAIGAASERFTPTDVAGGPAGGFEPPAPGPGPDPGLQPCNIGCGTGPGPTPVAGPPPVAPPPVAAAPPITVIESPAPPDPLPGLIK